MGSAFLTVLAWHTALNQAGIDQLLQLSTADVEVGGPRGAGHGSDLLRDWVGRAGIRLAVRRVFARGDVVVVDQAGQWRAADGQLAEPQDVASVFRTQNGRVASVIRHPDLAAALLAGGLGESDEIQPPWTDSRAI